MSKLSFSTFSCIQCQRHHFRLFTFLDIKVPTNYPVGHYILLFVNHSHMLCLVC
uniref:Uncharacterized protein n=1 Tax=Arundo donax TaxID=35708 RepID=A0A0A8ZCT1_ARUDO